MQRRMTVDTVELEHQGSIPAAGQLLQALYTALNLHAEHIGAVHYVGQRIFIDIDARISRSFLTPHPLLWTGGKGVLRRESDLPSSAPMSKITLERAFATAGELANSCYDDASIHGEDIGVIRDTGGATSFELSAWQYRRSDLPTSIGGAAAKAEKKKAESIGRAARRAQTLHDEPVEALRRLLERQEGDSQAVRHTVNSFIQISGTDPSVHRAARRLAANGWQVCAPLPMTSAWELILRLSLATSDEIERVRELLGKVTFPTDTHLEAEDLVTLLAAERMGVPHAIEPLGESILSLAKIHGLETRVLGTFLPGARAIGAVLADPPASVEFDDIGAKWLKLATGLMTDDTSIDTYFADVCAVMDSPSTIGDWNALKTLVAEEIKAEATPLRTPLSVLEPQTDRFIETAAASIDASIQNGDIDTARTVAIRSVYQRPDSSALIARAIRLGSDIEHLTPDSVVLAMAGERAWIAGDKEDAISAFLQATPQPGTLTAQHIARRLAWGGYLDEALSLLNEQSSISLRLTISLALDRMDDAAALWVTSIGDRLGLLPLPYWASAQVRAGLSPSNQALIEGDYARLTPSAAPALAHHLEALQADPFHCWTAPSPAPPVESVLEAILSTPDAHDALISVAQAELDVETTKSAIHWLVEQIPPERWEPMGIHAWSLLAARIGSPLSIPHTIVAQWLHHDQVEYVSAAELIMQTANGSVYNELWHHAPSARLLRAQAAHDTGDTTQARQIASALITRTMQPQVRQNAARLLLSLRSEEVLASLLAPTRSHTLHYDILTAVQTHMPTSAYNSTLESAVQLISETSPMHRVRHAAKTVLQHHF